MKKPVLIFLLFFIHAILYLYNTSAQNTFQEILPLQGSFSNFNDYLKMNTTKDSGCIISCTFFGSSNTVGVILKLDKFGNRVWGNSLEGLNDIRISSVEQTKDGGYIISGEYEIVNLVVYNFLLIKPDSSGQVQWKRTIGDSLVAHSSSVKQTTDGGFISIGDFDMTWQGNYEGLIVKTDSAGNIEWTQAITNGTNYLESVEEIVGVGYIVTGFQFGFGTYKNIEVIKLNYSGNILWKKNFTGNNDDYAKKVLLANDSTYIIAGNTNSTVSGTNEFLLMNLDKNGNTLWSKTYGTTNGITLSSVNKTVDHGYILTGSWIYYLWIKV